MLSFINPMRNTGARGEALSNTAKSPVETWRSEGGTRRGGEIKRNGKTALTRLGHS